MHEYANELKLIYANDLICILAHANLDNYVEIESATSGAN